MDMDCTVLPNPISSARMTYVSRIQLRKNTRASDDGR